MAALWLASDVVNVLCTGPAWEFLVEPLEKRPQLACERFMLNFYPCNIPTNPSTVNGAFSSDRLLTVHTLVGHRHGLPDQFHRISSHLRQLSNNLCVRVSPFWWSRKIYPQVQPLEWLPDVIFIDRGIPRS